MSQLSALVVGGTGPTGHLIVNGLRERGYTVAMLHSGRHERDEIPDDVEHIHTDAFDPEAFDAAIRNREFDLALVSYGRLRRIAQSLAGRVGRFVSIGGVPAYRGYNDPDLHDPAGLPVPTPEDASLVHEEADDPKGWRIVRTEQAVFDAHPEATHFRYPIVYGPYQLLPREWCVVRRVLDGRPHIILPEDGLSLETIGFVENLAHALLLAVDQPQAAAGQIFNCGDEEVLSLRQWVECIAAELGAPLEIVSMPWELAWSARPLIGQLRTTHRVMDLSKLRTRLGYRDVVPAREAVARTARWLRENPPPRGGTEEIALTDPFDYAAEDALIQNWQRALAALPKPEFDAEPDYTLAYSGPGGRPRPREFA